MKSDNMSLGELIQLIRRYDERVSKANRRRKRIAISFRGS